ncbi:MAG: hypothetical protein QXN55_07965 [Candidatus Nitrosotenuis sp.]
MKSAFLLVIFVMMSCSVPAFAQNIQQIQHADIAELTMKKYQITIDDTPFTIFYRFSTVGAGEGSDEDLSAKLVSITINTERKSLVMTIDSINQTDIMSIRFPQELVSAEGGKLVLLLDGKEKGYESNTQDNKRTMIFVLPKDSSQVEIVGTKVIPEFPSALLVMIVILPSIFLMSYFFRTQA